MPNIIRGKIDVSKIDKDRLFRGSKGTYLDFVLLPVDESKYGETHLVKQDISKEDREAGVRGEILGNATEITKNGEGPKAAKAAPKPKAVEDDLPFDHAPQGR